MSAESAHEPRGALRGQPLPGGQQARGPALAGRRVRRGDAWWTSPAVISKQRYGKPGNVYVGLVHRLDRPTSGVVLLARTSKAAGRLSAQFRAGTIAKVYWAIVEGSPDEDEGDWADRLEKDRRTNRSRSLAGIGGGRQGGEGGLPGAGTLGRARRSWSCGR